MKCGKVKGERQRMWTVGSERYSQCTKVNIGRKTDIEEIEGMEETVCSLRVDDGCGCHGRSRKKIV